MLTEIKYLLHKYNIICKSLDFLWNNQLAFGVSCICMHIIINVITATKKRTIISCRYCKSKKKTSSCHEALLMHRALSSSFRATEKRTSSLSPPKWKHTQTCYHECITYTGRELWVWTDGRTNGRWRTDTRNVNLPWTEVYRHASATYC